MNRHGLQQVWRVGALMAAALLAGCAGIPETIAPLPQEMPSRAEVLADPEAARGTTVVWGGVIAAIDNREDGTRLELVARSLDRSGRPRDSDRSEGRFRAWTPEFLDPQIHAPGREVTVRGEVEGVERDAIGDYPYTYVTLRATGVHLWPVREPPRDPLYHDPWFWPGFYDPYWRHHPHPLRHAPGY
ncbi:MAG: Slp family lipoprotein [Pseudomonadota bacterium]